MQVTFSASGLPTHWSLQSSRSLQIGSVSHATFSSAQRFVGATMSFTRAPHAVLSTIWNAHSQRFASAMVPVDVELVVVVPPAPPPAPSPPLPPCEGRVSPGYG